VLSSHHWAEHFIVSDDDIEYLTGILLEREIPLSSEELALALIERHLQEEEDAFKERFKNVLTYNPAQPYAVGQKLVFPMLDYALATVVSVRDGNNPEYGEFKVIRVAFENGSDANGSSANEREFAAELSVPHKLNNADDNGKFPGLTTQTPAEILEENRSLILPKLQEKLASVDDLISVAGKWFSRGLMLDVNIGHLNLAEAVLDMTGGAPMTTEQILQDIGGVGKAPMPLQIFCMNYALNGDNRFDEVGPVDTVLWALKRLEPAEVQTTPPMLIYHRIDYDPTLLTPEMVALEAEIDDEWSEVQEHPSNEAQITLIYPHRRVGTLPMNATLRAIFPTARRTLRVYVTLVDGQDGEEYTGWVVRQERYVVGLSAFYTKHKLPVGAHVLVRQSDEPGKVIINYKAYRPRTEWVRLITPTNGQVAFEEQRRSIGAEYDDLMLLGADDLAAVDALFQANQRRALPALLRTLIQELSRSSPQGTVHAKTLYSALNVLRRCPPGPMLATLLTTPEFEHVGSHYWKLSQ
jgi:hypothetical protein